MALSPALQKTAESLVLTTELHPLHLGIFQANGFTVEQPGQHSTPVFYY